MARNFDASSYIRLEESVISAAPFTIFIWFKCGNNGTKTFMFIGDKDSDTEYWAIQQRYEDSLNYVRGRVFSGTAAHAVTSTTFSLNSWHNAVLREVSASDRNALLDAAGEGTNNSTKAPSNADRTTIGVTDKLSPANYLNGDLAWACVWDISLSDNEISSLNTGVNPMILRSQNIVCLVPLDGNAINYAGSNFTLSGTTKATTAPPVQILGEVYF
jgi:hypothetical protein